MNETPPARAEAEASWAGREFVSATIRGGGASALFEWMCDNLVASGWLRLNAPDAPYFDVMEPGAGKVTVPLVGERTRAQDAAIVEISIAALRAVLRALKLIRDKRGGGVFLHNAVVGGHVQQVSTASGLAWVPVLREGQQLSNWVLAMFAADMLQDGRDPAGHLSVCDRCGHVWIEESGSELCSLHRGEPGLRPMRDFVEGGPLLQSEREPPRDS